MNQPSLLELCDHARRSCTVNGLRPMEWRWGNDMIQLYFSMCAPHVHQLPPTFQGMPVIPMATLDARGVACIGKKPYVSLLKKE